MIAELTERWGLTVGKPFDGREISAGWVAPATRAGEGPAVLKLGMPHMEARDEIAGLRFWNADPTVQLLDADPDENAMLLERCAPGTVLRKLDEPAQDLVIAGLLRRLWRPVPEPHPFRPLFEMTAHWTAESRADEARWADAGLAREGLHLFEELPRTAPTDVLLATDVHAGNVLQAEREPWLVIDPKPFVGDPAYDVTQHLFNCSRLHTEPLELIRRLADLVGLDEERIRLWMFARAASETRAGDGKDVAPLARKLAP